MDNKMQISREYHFFYLARSLVTSCNMPRLHSIRWFREPREWLVQLFELILTGWLIFKKLCRSVTDFPIFFKEAKSFLEIKQIFNDLQTKNITKMFTLELLQELLGYIYHSKFWVGMIVGKVWSRRCDGWRWRRKWKRQRQKPVRCSTDPHMRKRRWTITGFYATLSSLPNTGYTVSDSIIKQLHSYPLSWTQETFLAKNAIWSRRRPFRWG